MEKVLARYFSKQTDEKVLCVPDVHTQSAETTPLNTISTSTKTAQHINSPKLDRSNASFNGVNETASDSGIKSSVSSISSSDEAPPPTATATATATSSPDSEKKEGGGEENSQTTKVGDSDSVGSQQHPTKPNFSFFSCPPRDTRFVGLIDFLSNRGMKHTCDQPIEFCSRKEKTLHKTYLSLNFISQLCDAAISVFAEEKNVLDIDVDASETIIVVGDIHGQFNDLFTSVLVQQYSPELNPTKENKKFLFLGDFVDRGPHSLDVILLIFALKVEFPHLIFITRGNHEESKTSRVYGFLAEMQAKLGDEGSPAWSKINSVFPYIPLCAVVTTPHLKFFATHGGLSPALLDQISSIAHVERREYCGTLKGSDEDIVNGLLWSDPTTDVGFYDRNPRGCGVLFGPSASASFCEKNGLDFICRAHQVVTDGFLWRHNNKVVTIFSAPNYCGINGNLGAVMEVKGSSSSPTFVQYECFEDLLDDWQMGPSKNFPYASCFN